MGLARVDVQFGEFLLNVRVALGCRCLDCPLVFAIRRKRATSNLGDLRKISEKSFGRVRSAL
jgi:hypothetical protein